MEHPVTPNTYWHAWHQRKPEVGAKIVILCDDGCTVRPALVVSANNPEGIDVLDGEDGMPLSDVPRFLEGAMWCRLPHDYPLAMMD